MHILLFLFKLKPYSKYGWQISEEGQTRKRLEVRLTGDGEEEESSCMILRCPTDSSLPYLHCTASEVVVRQNCGSVVSNLEEGRARDGGGRIESTVSSLPGLKGLHFENLNYCTLNIDTCPGIYT